MGRTIRTCSAATLAIVLATAPAAQARIATSPLTDYALARISLDEIQSAQSYARALADAPDSLTIAWRSYRKAVIVGDYALSLRAAQSLERAGALPPEARLLLYIAALKTRDWREAARRLNDVTREPSLAFIAPSLSAWLRLGSRETLDLSDVKDVGGPNAYGAESDALVAIARGDAQKGIDSIRTLWPLDPYRLQSLRLVAAATLVRRKQTGLAESLLTADTLSTRRAKAAIAAGRKLSLATDTPLSGTAFVLARLGGDLTVDGSGTAAITLARFAQFADPGNARIALGAAGALTDGKRPALALTIVDTLLDDPIYGDDAASLRIELLEALDRYDDAVAAAEERAGRSSNDMARLGDMAMRHGDFAAAARRFDQAIAMSEGQPGWTLLHAAGNAHLLAGDWPRAREVLEAALKRAPEEPLVLNSLGFGLVDQGDDARRGRALIEKAAELRPGNASIIDSQGWAAYRSGDLVQAIAALERARSLEPVQAEISEHLGDVYWAAGRRIDARYAWAAARVQGDTTAHARLDAKIARGLP